MRAVVLEQQSVGLRIGEVVDRDELEIVIVALQQRAGDQPPNPSEPVDRYLGRHVSHIPCRLPVSR